MQSQNNNQGFVKDLHYFAEGPNGTKMYSSYTGQVDINGMPHGKGISSSYTVNNLGKKEILYDMDGTFIHGNAEGMCTYTSYEANQTRTGNYTNGRSDGYGLTEYGDGRALYANSTDQGYEPGSKMMMYKLHGSQGSGTYFGTFGNDGQKITFDKTKFIKNENIPKQVFEMER